MKKLFILSTILILCGSFFAGNVHADTTTTPAPYQFLAPITTSQGQATNPDLGIYVKNMYALLISLSAVIAVIMIIYGGLLYMSTDAISQKKNGKEIIVRTLWGLILIIGSYVLLATINPNLLNFSFLSGIQTSSGPTTDAGSWCTNVVMTFMGTNTQITNDCSNQTSCPQQQASWNNNTLGRTYSVPNGCQAVDMGGAGSGGWTTQKWCMNVHVSYNNMSVGQDCTAGYAYMADADIQASVLSKIESYNNKSIKIVQQNAFLSPGQPSTLSDYFINSSNQACILTEQSSTPDCTAGGPYWIPDTDTEATCNSNISAWQGTKITAGGANSSGFVASSCVDISTTGSGPGEGQPCDLNSTTNTCPNGQTCVPGGASGVCQSG